MPITVKNEQELINLYDEYYNKIYNYLRKKVSNRETAEDLTSSVFLSALSFIKKKKQIIHFFSVWIYRIATNELIKYLNKKKKQKTISMHKGENPLEQKLKNGKSEFEKKFVEFHTIKKALEKLPPKDAAVVHMHFFEGKEYSELSQILKMKETTLRSIIHRALKKLGVYINLEEGGSGK